MTGALGRFIRDERAQASVEYILLLTIAVGFFMILVRTVIRPLSGKFRDSLSRYIENTLFSKQNLHRLPIGR